MSLAGCYPRVSIEIETEIDADGSFERRVTYVGDKEILSNEHELPAGGSWQVTSTEDEDELTYRAVGRFQALETDYAKQDAQVPPAWSRNSIEIRATPDGYSYRETFSDTTHVEEFRRLQERHYSWMVEHIFAALPETVFQEENAFVLDTIRRRVITSVMGDVDQLWHELEGISSKSDSEFTDRLGGRMHELIISHIDRWWEAEGLHYPGGEARNHIEQAIEALEETEEMEAWFASYQEETTRYGGAHLPSGASYRFKVTVLMPTKLCKSNATRVEGNRATWEFDSQFFLVKDYVLEATCERTSEEAEDQ